jgi:hypothetical protein
MTRQIVKGVSFKVIADFYDFSDKTIARAFQVNGIAYKKISPKGKHIDNGIHKATLADNIKHVGHR